jgi:hypothetical protein
MSADNWTTCPRCLSKCQDDKEKDLNNLQAKYGKIPAEEYLAELEKAKAMPDEPEETLLEDYELGVGPDGEFYVMYSCICRVCSWKFSFKHAEQTI